MAGYIFLGLVLNEHLDYKTVKNVTQCANRAVLAKSKHIGGLAFKIYYEITLRFYLGIVKHRSNAAVHGDLSRPISQYEYQQQGYEGHMGADRVPIVYRYTLALA